MQQAEKSFVVLTYSNVPLTATAANNKALQEVNTRSLCLTPAFVSTFDPSYQLLLTFFRSTQDQHNKHIKRYPH